MPRPRSIQAAEAPMWLAELLSYGFSRKSAERHALIYLLGIAYDVTAHPEDVPNWQLAQLLLQWAENNVPVEDWRRLQGRVRKRRASA